MTSNTHNLFSVILIYLTIKIALVLSQEEKEEFVSYTISCGSSSTNKDSTGQNWDPDSKFLDTSSGESKQVLAEIQDPSLPSIVPYMSARIFTQQSSYKFPVSSNSRLWLRLHFYPSLYPSYPSKNSYFSVVANDFTLLNNFSASITAEALTLAYIVYEFSLTPVESGDLNLTFVPSSQPDHTFAFVNGIEVIPMPEIFQTAEIVGYDQIIDVETNSLQTMFRLNVGGQFISSENDSLRRIWYDDMPYLYGAGYGVTSQANITIEYTNDAYEDIAPRDVYATSRSMGANAKLNAAYNLTWVFEVHANFSYLIRLHFCEYVFTKVNQRVFDIYINNQTATSSADVLVWAGVQGEPIYKDFFVFAEDQELWLALHPNGSTKPEYIDSFLNGLEIFKLNDADNNLAGPNPEPSEMFVEAQEESSQELSPSGSSDHSRLIESVTGGAAGFSIVAFATFVIVTKKRKNVSGGSSGRSVWMPIYRSFSRANSSISKSDGSSRLTSLGGGLCRHFKLAEMKKGTKNFHESKVIGVGGFGKVYKGVIDKRTLVAIKRSNPGSEQGINEFQTEIELLSKLRHNHLVSLIGFCEEYGEMILVYDYMANGTLREHIYKTNKPPLTWNQRLDICIGAARGLHYLHTGAKYTIIHRDVKTTNILLDDKWVAKVSDFGLSKIGTDLHQNHFSTMVKGSFGYLDPEYFKRQQLTEKSDVYSFGVVLFEVLCGRPALNTSLPDEQVSLADWALHCKRKGCFEDLIDPFLEGTIDPKCLKNFLDTAEKCLSDNGIDRPSMGDVLWNLEYASQAQRRSGVGDTLAEHKEKESHDLQRASLSIDKNASSKEESSDSDTCSDVFSQLMKQTGR